MKFWILWGFDALVALVPVYFLSSDWATAQSDGTPAYTAPKYKTQNRAANTYGGMAKFAVNGQTV